MEQLEWIVSMENAYQSLSGAPGGRRWDMRSLVEYLVGDYLACLDGPQNSGNGSRSGPAALGAAAQK